MEVFNKSYSRSGSSHSLLDFFLTNTATYLKLFLISIITCTNNSPSHLAAISTIVFFKHWQLCSQVHVCLVMQVEWRANNKFIMIFTIPLGQIQVFIKILMICLYSIMQMGLFSNRLMLLIRLACT